MKTMSDIYIFGHNDELYPIVEATVAEGFQLKHVTPEDLKKLTIQIVLVLKTEEESPLDQVQHVLSEQPDAAVVFVNNQPEFELLRDLTRLGVNDYFVLPEEEWLLTERIKGLAEAKLISKENTTAEGFRRGGGKVFTFYSGKGGTGKSLISSTFAQTLKLESTGKVLYIDLNMQYGGAETFLGIDSERSVIDLLPVINELNEHHLRNVSETLEPSGLDVLVSPRDAEIAEKIDESFIMRLIRASKRSYDFIIIDTPSNLDVKTFTALEESDRIYYLMNLDTISIRVLKGVETLLKQLGVDPEERLELIINFKGKDNELSKKDIERFVTYTIASEIRRDFKGVQAHMNKGEPLRREPQEKKLTPVAKDIQKWVRSMLK
ncbi:hypothetical protein JNUCC1_03056 [Lentibacillus sp. JNUCC-1]|uniref:AAA family ATPase n=1 Tax=Lentibacillus sp. JNUCC-1 TaxID=2654513 RepID=UPI0012E84B35|nr:AAA family ATPase [Lentibacillus sp. JNUCC-1]MUV39183.1 hypothetical protein [Lentibacillus sp. JNUCC-1]